MARLGGRFFEEIYDFALAKFFVQIFRWASQIWIFQWHHLWTVPRHLLKLLTRVKSKTFSNKISELSQNYPKRKFFFPKFFHVNQEKPIPKKWSMVNFNFFFHLNFFIFHFRKFSHFLFGGRKRKNFQIGNCFLGGKFRIALKGKFEEKLLRWILLLVWTYENVK